MVTMQNGIPWWYFLGLPGPYQGTRIEAVDPGGVIAASLDYRRVIGCVVYPAAEIDAAGGDSPCRGQPFLGWRAGRHRNPAHLGRSRSCSARQGTSRRWSVTSGPKSGSSSGATSASIRSARFATRLWSTSATSRCRGWRPAMMEETQRSVRSWASISGYHWTTDCRRRGRRRAQNLDAARRRAGRTLELEALVGRSSSCGRITSIPTPHIDAVYALCKLAGQRAYRMKGQVEDRTGERDRKLTANSHREEEADRLRTFEGIHDDGFNAHATARCRCAAAPRSRRLHSTAAYSELRRWSSPP